VVRQYLCVVGVLGTHTQDTHGDERGNEPDDIDRYESPLVYAVFGVGAVGAPTAAVLTGAGIIAVHPTQLIVAEVSRVHSRRPSIAIGGIHAYYVDCLSLDDRQSH